MRLKRMPSIVVSLKDLTLTDVRFVEKLLSLIRLIMESSVIKIVFLGQGSVCTTLLTDIRGSEKCVLLELSDTLIFCSMVVSDDEWLNEVETLLSLLDLWVLFVWDVLSLKDLDSLPGKLISYRLNFSETFGNILLLCSSSV